MRALLAMGLLLFLVCHPLRVRGMPIAERRRVRMLRRIAEWCILWVAVGPTYVLGGIVLFSGSMAPAARVRDLVLTTCISHRYLPIRRGEVILFTRSAPPDGRAVEFVKRVVGVAGDHLAVLPAGDHGGLALFVNGTPVDEPYLDKPMVAGEGPLYSSGVEVPDGTVYVLGDTRGNSRDSREFGPVPVESVTRQAIAVVGRHYEFRWLPAWSHAPD
jgi:signal peptidase I